MIRSLVLSVWVVLSSGLMLRAAEQYNDTQPYWILLHEPAAVKELKLSPDQQRRYQTLLDELDLKFFPLRNKSKEEADTGLAKIVQEAQAGLKPLLRPAQSRRLTQMLMWRVGIASVLHPDAAKQIGYSKSQRMRMEDVLSATAQSAEAIEKQVQAGEPREPLEQKYLALQTDGQKKLLEILKPEQQTAWKETLGPQFDVKTLGAPRYKVPELAPMDHWINGSPVTLEKLRGKVVVVHFYACGCSNCIANYPWYRQWHEKFRDEKFAMIGIQTPETDAERNLAHVRQQAAEAKLEFPILFDSRSENWQRWGNSMWPSVYVIDQQGYLRHFWPGELNWKGNNGEKFLRERIEALLAEGK